MQAGNTELWDITLVTTAIQAIIGTFKQSQKVKNGKKNLLKFNSSKIFAAFYKLIH